MKTQIVVVGAGYAGVMAANNLAGRHAVTLVNPRPFFVERIRLHQFVVDTHTARRPLTDVLHPDVRLEIGSATRIAAAEQRVVLANGSALPYDFLVYAAGSRAAPPPIPGAEHAFTLAEWESAQGLRAALGGNVATLTVVGGGLTGIEAASEIAEQRPATRVRLVSAGSVGQGLSPRAQQSILRRLQRLGVEVLEHRRVEAITPHSIRVAGEELASELTLLAAGLTAARLARDSGLTVDADGRLATDAALRSIDSDRIVAAGDAAAPPAAVAAHLRMSCAAAFPLGTTAARTVDALVQGREPEPLSLGFLFQCISIGRSGGVVQPVTPDDRPRALAIGGWSGKTIKEAICNGTIKWLAREGRRPGSYKWPAGPRHLEKAASSP